MITRALRLAGAMVLLAIVAGAWLRWVHDPGVRRNAVLAVGADSLDRAVDSLRGAVTQAAARRRADSLRLTALGARATALQTSATRAAAWGDSLEHGIRALRDSTVPKVVALAALAAKDTAIVALRAEVDTLARAKAILDHQVHVYADSVLPRYQLALAAAIAQRDAFRTAPGRPSLLRGVLTAAGCLAAGIGAESKSATLGLGGGAVCVAGVAL